MDIPSTRDSPPIKRFRDCPGGFVKTEDPDVRLTALLGPAGFAAALSGLHHGFRTAHLSAEEKFEHSLSAYPSITDDDGVLWHCSRRSIHLCPRAPSKSSNSEYIFRLLTGPSDWETLTDLVA
jgi:hypothetical protein